MREMAVSEREEWREKTCCAYPKCYAKGRKKKKISLITGQFPPLLPTQRVSCIDRINSGIPPVDNEQ
jgi:hypothetical protein